MEPITKIVINGISLDDFSYLSLTQRIYEHHSFEVVIGHEVMETLGGHTLDKSKDWVGKLASITLGESDFVGIVTSVDMVHNHGMFGDLVIKGYSKTILLESGNHLHSWTEKSLKDVMKETIDRAGIQSTVAPEYSGTIGYISQHRESNYSFVKRVACQYNEWMFYDGEKLIFGKPGSMPTIPMAYGTDMDNVRVSVNMRPVKYKGFSYHSLRDESMDGATKDTVSGLDELGDHGFSSSKDNFSFVPTISMGPRVPDKGSLDDVLKRLQSASAANLSVISGSSSKQELRPGVIADIGANIFDNKSWSSKPYGQYLITAVHHQATGDKVYSNHFEGIPAGVKVLPEPSMPMPVAYPQIATVLSNTDPEKKGRVQIQFQWQLAEGLNTSWIRVMTPDAGSSDIVAENRGFVFIPEVGDQVMVGFRYGDPSRPFVMGSVFHGTNGKGGDSNNKMKSITTRSGSTITFDDEGGKGNILIKDADDNLMIFDGEGNVSVVANKTITLSVGKSILTMDSEGNILLAGQSVMVLGEKDATIASLKNEQGSSLALDPTKAELVGKDNLKMGGGTTADLESPTVNVSGSGEVKVAGGKINLN